MNQPQADIQLPETRLTWTTPLVTDLDVARNTTAGGNNVTDGPGTRDGS